MHKVYNNHGRVTAIPPSFPTPYEVATALASDIINNPQRYQLRGRCLIKITSFHIDRTLLSMGFFPDAINPRSYSGYKSIVFAFLDYLLDKNGFKLAYRIGGHTSGKRTRRYYIMPQCPEPRAKG